MTTLLCLGFGYTAQHLLPRLDGFEVLATYRDPHKADALRQSGVRPVQFSDDLSRVTHLLASAPPDAAGDPLLAHLPPMPNLVWAGYLSATSVYGDHQGGWVTEETPTTPSGPRGQQRVMAEQAWLSSGLPIHIFRLAGIYGPQRCVLDDLKAGTARRIDAPGQVFSRIHIDDITSTLLASMQKPNCGAIYNVADDEPAASADVLAYGAELLGLAAPPLVPLENAALSPMAQSFYTDNRRISNQRLKTELGVMLAYPTYREGLKALLLEPPRV